MDCVTLAANLAALLVLGELALLARCAPPRPWWRLAPVIAGGLLLVACVALPPQPWREQHARAAQWQGGVVVGLAATVVPLLLTLGLPGVAARPVLDEFPRARPPRTVWRLLGHPVLVLPVNCLVLVLVFSSGWYHRVQAGGWGWLGLLLVVLAGGLAADAVLLWPSRMAGRSPGLRVLFGGVAALVWQVPGVAVMAVEPGDLGAALWATTQLAVLPLMVVLLVAWWRHDRELAARTDAELDALEQARAEQMRSVLASFLRDGEQRGQ